ncbi:MAG: NAD(P)/FAD-dependent oxidoreductase [Pyrinomonadaceae bacterium]
MNSRLKNSSPKIIVVGAGPAGASLAIRLAKENFEVCLIEREKFPRQKLCGEFVSPECLAHFRALGVLREMLAVGGERISETVFYEPNGKSVSVPSAWFNADLQGALSISRAEMDFRLMEKARGAGVSVLEETAAIGLLFEKDKVCGVKVRTKNNELKEITAGLTIDATGRARVLDKLAEKNQLRITNYELREKIQNPKSKIQNRLVGFKTHLENANVEKGRCEIYFFRGGYGGLSFIENNLANHCFLVKADLVKEFNSNSEQIFENVIFQNKRARETLKSAKPVYDWLAVSVDGFGVKNLNPAPNLFSVGDAAAFIDPFTGSGMLMALESAEILAEEIAENQFSIDKIAEKYKARHRRKFQKRLLVCSVMRHLAFVPSAAKALIFALSFSRAARQILARSTRQTPAPKKIK